MNSKEILLEQMTACYDEKNWFVPLQYALKGLSEEQASWKDGITNHSISQIVNHLIFWNERNLNRFKGITPPEMKDDNKSTFKEKNIDEVDADWSSNVERLNSIMSEFRNEIMKADESKLKSSPYKDTNEPWYLILANTNIHNAYHIGQIVCIRKLQGSWDPEQGVK